MYKKLLFSLVLMAIGFTTSYAQSTLTVYDGDATNVYVPVYGFYADAFTKVEFIMNADELSEMTGGTISSMTWYLASPAEVVWGGRFQIFVKEVTNTTLDAYMGMEGATIVYDGPLDGTNPELVIDFTEPYTYQGGNLLIGVYGVEKGTYKSASFAGMTVPGASVQGYSYSELDASSINQRDFLPKTTFVFVSDGVVYYRPTNMLVSDITANGANITWTPGSDETSWNVEYKMHNEEEWISAGSVAEPAITLDVLQNGTVYDVRVQSDYGEGNLSGWTTTTFTTLVCDADDMGEITYILTDTYGDGWNGNKLQIVYHNTGALIAELTIPSGGNLEEGTINLCYGEDYDLIWVASNYGYECGFQVLDPYGDPIYEFQGTGSSSGPVPTAGVLTTFMITRDGCARPNDVTASNIVYNGATLTWTPGNEEQDLWEVVYGTGEFNPDEAEPIIVNGTPTVQLTGLQENTTYTAYVRSDCGRENMSRWSKPCSFTTPLQFALPTNLAVDKITAKSAEATWNGEALNYNLRYRMKTTLGESFEEENLPAGWTVNGNWVVMPISEYNMGGVPLSAQDGGSCMASISVDENTGASLGSDDWLISPKVNLGGMLEFYVSDLGPNYVENYSVYVSTTGNNPADFVALGENLQTVGVLNEWEQKQFDLSAYAGQQGYIAIRHHDAQGYYIFVDAVSVAGEGVEGAEWVVMEGVNSPVTMEPLEAGTTYEVQVQGVYADGVSGWTDLVNFTTVAADALPTNLEVTAVTATTADVNWVGSQDAYNLRYRTAAILNGLTEDFSNYSTGDIPTGWTVVDADGDGQNWYVWNLTLDDGTVQTTLSSNSYINNYGALTPDNWIYTPLTKLGSVVRFVAWGQDPSYAAEHFRVYVSTNGTDIADFVPVSEEIVATGEKTTYSFDISQFAGEMGYIAIRHYNVSDMYILNVTDFYLAGEEEDVPAGDWIVINNVTPPYTIEGLTPATDYEVQVQGIFEGRATTEWTSSVFFTTLDEEVPPTEQTEAPSIAADTQQGVHAYFVTITPSEDSEIYYRYCKDNGEWSDWILYDDVVPFEEDGYYQVEAYAIANGKTESLHVSCSFTVTPRTGLDELNGDKAVSSVRYFNVAGQEMAQPNGMTIVVTTYTDGTTVATKVMK